MGKWVRIRNQHINTDQVISFMWSESLRKLCIQFADGDRREFDDEEKQWYRILCCAIGEQALVF